MALLWEYHGGVRRFLSVAVAVAGAWAVSLLLAIPAAAQINGAPASVTSPGFGGRAINGTPPSVTSLGPRGFAPSFRPPLSDARNGVHRDRADGNRHHRRDWNNSGPAWYAVPYAIPYDYENGQTDYQDDPSAGDNSSDYQGGPTIFDRRGSGANSYIPPVQDAAPAHSPQNSVENNEAPANPEPPLPPTLLVFKDGHTLEISNYAIVGPTLFDLTAGHRRKIPLSDLDLEATRKQNEDRGVNFEVPPSGQGS